MHLNFEDNPHDNMYSNCTILSLAWTPFYDDDLFRQYLRAHMHQDPQNNHFQNQPPQQQQQTLNDQLNDLNANARQPQSTAAVHAANISGQTSSDNQQLNIVPNITDSDDLSEYRRKFTNEGRSEYHGWLAVGNINGVVGVTLTKCSLGEVETSVESDQDDEQQDEEQSLYREEKCSSISGIFNHKQSDGDRKDRPKRVKKNKRSGMKGLENGVRSALNHYNNPDDKAFKANHHLRGHHGAEILIVKWNEHYQRLATVDSKGCIFIWSKRNGRFQIESPLNNRNKTVVDFDWSNDGETALICYVDSFVLVGSGYGQRYWHSMLNLDDYHITCGVWSPDDEQLIFGVSNGSILVIYLQNSELTELTVRERSPIRSMCWSKGSTQKLPQWQDHPESPPLPAIRSSDRLQHSSADVQDTLPQEISGEHQDNNGRDDGRHSPYFWVHRPANHWTVLTESLRSIARPNLNNSEEVAASSSTGPPHAGNNTNYYRINRINTAIRWRQQSTAAMYNSNQRLYHPVVHATQANPSDSLGLISSEFSGTQQAPSFNILTDLSSTVGKNVLAVDFCDGTIHLYSGGLDDPDPRIISTNLSSLQMQWNNDGSLLAVSGSHPVPSLSVAISLIESLDSGKSVKEITENLTIDLEREKRSHPCVRPDNYYLNVVHFYTPQGNLRYSQFIKHYAHPVSALTWAHKDRRLFVATGPVLHTAHVYTNVPSLEVLAKATIKRMIKNRDTKFNSKEEQPEIHHDARKSEFLCQCHKTDKYHSTSTQINKKKLDLATVAGHSKVTRESKTKRRLQQNCEQVFRLPLPTKLLHTIDDMFTRTLRCQVPTSESARDFIWRVPAPNVRFFCTLICYESHVSQAKPDPISTSSSTSVQLEGGESNFILYLEYLGSLIPILKAKRIGQLKPEFIIFDPQPYKQINTQARTKSTKDKNNCQNAAKNSSDSRHRDSRSKAKLKTRLRSKSATPSLEEPSIEDNINTPNEEVCSFNYDTSDRHGFNFFQASSLARYVDENPSELINAYLSGGFSPDTYLETFNLLYGHDECDITHLQWPAIEAALAEARRAFRRHQYLHHYHAYDCLPEQKLLARVTSNFWGTKFKIVGCEPLPETLATMVYKTSLLHLQPRQLCITIKDLDTVCSNCFRLTNLNETTSPDIDTPQSSSYQNLDRKDDLDCHQSSRTVFLEVGDNLRIAPLSCTHRPVNSDLNQQAFVRDISNQSHSLVEHRQRRHRRDRHLPAPSTSSCENITNYNCRPGTISRSSKQSTSNTAEYLKESNNPMKTSKKRTSSESNQQQTRESPCVGSPSKKLALDGHIESEINKQQGCYNFVDDDDDILTLYMDRGSVNDSDKDRKRQSTASISMKMSSRCSSSNELYLAGNKKEDDLTLSTSQKKQQSNAASSELLQAPSETNTTLLSISTITKMIVDLSSKAANDDDLLVDASITNPKEDGIVRNDQSFPSQNNTYIPPVPQTPVHRPRRRANTNVSVRKDVSDTGCRNSPSRVVHYTTGATKVEVCPPSSISKDQSCHSWSNQNDTNCNHSSQAAPPHPPKRKFTKKLREQFKKSTISLNLGSSFGSCADYELQQPLLQENNHKYKVKVDNRHLATQSQPCTPLKKKYSERGAYENAGLEERLQDLDGSSFSKNGILTHESFKSESNAANKENDSFWDASRPRRCQSTTKLVTKAIRRRFTYFDCTSNGEIDCVRRPNLQSKEDLQTSNSLTKINPNIKTTLLSKDGNDKSQCPNIEGCLKEHILLNKPPVWNAFSQVYQLDFGGRVTQESAKNFQIEYKGQLAMQFGRVDNRTYTLDFQYPFNAVQAMGVALASLTQRLK